MKLSALSFSDGLRFSAWACVALIVVDVQESPRQHVVEENYQQFMMGSFENQFTGSNNRERSVIPFE